MEITFTLDGTLAERTFILVRRSGLRFGKIFHAAGVYRFYLGDHEKLGGADLEGQDLEKLKTAIRSKYGAAQ
jgi:hypothetical protein